MQRIDTIDIKEAKKQLLKMELEDDYLKFVQYAFLMTEKKLFSVANHHRVLATHMQDIWKGKYQNSIGNIAPRFSKTTMCVKYFVAWSYAKNKKCNFIHLSYSDALVLNTSSEIREMIASDWFQDMWPMEFRKDKNAKNEWSIESGGTFYAAPTGGQVTGRGAGAADPTESPETYDWLEKYDEIFERPKAALDGGFNGCILIDDPTKPTDADSDLIMAKTNNRLINTIMSRRNSPKKTPIMIIMQRVHENDMTGFCLDGNTGERWHHLSLPALAEDENGDEYSIWPEKFTLQMLKQMERENPIIFAGQYMQRPAPAEGILFKKDMWKFTDACPHGPTVRGYDLAASKGINSAKTASVKLTMANGNFYISDVQADKLSPAEVEANILLNAQLDGKKVKIDFPQDPGQAGKFQKEYLISKLAGYIVESTPETGSKEHRAKGMSSQQTVGNVYLVRGDWNKPFIAEATTFPNGKYKDMIDAASRAFHSVLEFDSSGFDDNDLNDDNISISQGVTDDFF